MKRQRAVSISDLRCMRCSGQNLLDDNSSLLCITLACNSLMNDTRGYVVVHSHVGYIDKGIAPTAVEHRRPVMIETKREKKSERM